MATLSFLDQLDAEQLKYARIIGEKARAIGIDPGLAISVAYQESRLRPSTPDSPKGAIGIMQVMPSTAATLNVEADALRAVEANINVGLKVLKLALNEAKGDPVKASIIYNAGGKNLRAFEEGKGLPDETRKYVGDLYSYGTFKDRPVPEGVQVTEPEQPSEQSADEPTAAPERGPVGQAMDFLSKASEELGPGGTGAAAGAATAIAEKIGAGPMSMAGEFARGMQPPAVSPTAPPAPPAAPSPFQQATRVLQGTPGDLGTTGRQRQMGYNEPTSQVAARRGVLTQDLGRIGLDPQRVFAEAADVASTPTGVLYPRGVVPPDLTPPPRLSPLDQAKKLVTDVMARGSQVARGVSSVARAVPMVSYPLAGYSIGSDIGEMREQMRKPKPDYTDVGLLGAGALGTLGAFSSALAPVALPVALGAPAARYLRSRLASDEPVTAEEEEAARRPAFGIYPGSGRRLAPPP